MRRSNDEAVPLFSISHPSTFHFTIHLNEEECRMAFTRDHSMDLGHDA